MTTPTTNQQWQKPVINGSSDTWGTELNALFDDQDADFKSLADAIAAKYAVPNGGIPSTDLSAAVQSALVAAVAAAHGWTITAVKTASYALGINEFVPVDTTSGAVTLTLPSTPAPNTRAGAKLIIQGTGNNVTIAASGGDVFNKAGGSTTLTLALPNQSISLEYKSGIWYVINDDLPLGQLDLRYASAANVVTTFNGQSGPITFNPAGPIIAYNGTAYPLRSTATSSATTPVTWVGPTAPSVGNGYAVVGVDMWINTTEVS